MFRDREREREKWSKMRAQRRKKITEKPVDAAVTPQRRR